MTVSPPLVPEDVLRSRGLRVTSQRLAVLVAVERLPHGDADQIAAQVHRSGGRISTQAVYDVLHALTQAGLLRRIEPAGSPARYETRTGDNHHHVVCRGCGVAADLDCSLAAAPCLDPGAVPGFSIDEAEITFWGTCLACQAANTVEHERTYR